MCSTAGPLARWYCRRCSDPPEFVLTVSERLYRACSLSLSIVLVSMYFFLVLYEKATQSIKKSMCFQIHNLSFESP